MPHQSLRRDAFTVISRILIAILFFAAGCRRQQNPLERAASLLDKHVSAKRIQAQLVELASRPHRAGTEDNAAVAQSICRRLKALGLEVHTDDFEVPLPEPVEVRLHLTVPEKKEFLLQEKVLDADPYSRVAAQQIPYYAYSPDGEVEADVVYANFGHPEDYARLNQLGVEVAGKIVLVRSAGYCRARKIVLAQENGAAGVLIFPELRDYGFRKLPFPQGPHINPWTFERGSVLGYYLKPGAPAEKDSVLPRIPALPVSQEIASELLRRLGGSLPGMDWKGWLQNAPYTTGPGPARVHFLIRSRSPKRKIRNIIARLPGDNPSEPYVLLSAHYDAWVYGASDPSSGVATLLETAQSLVEVRKEGIPLLRDILFCFWDAEEFGMIGSSKWVLENQHQLRQRAAISIFVDAAYKRREFLAYSMPGLRAALDEVLELVQEPSVGRSLSQLRGEYRLPGYSSDLSPILNYAGVPSVQLGFGNVYGVYHSLYDDLQWMNRYGDPDYSYHVALTKILTLYSLRFAGSSILPYDFGEIGQFVRDFLSSHRQYRNFTEWESKVQDWQRLASKLPVTSEDTRAKVNLLLVRAMQSLAAIDSRVPFPRRNLLIGPSEKTGCSGVPFPALNRHDSTKDDRFRFLSGLDRSTDDLDSAIRLVRSP